MCYNVAIASEMDATPISACLADMPDSMHEEMNKLVH